MNYIELLIDNYSGYPVVNKLDKLQALSVVLNSIDNQLNELNKIYNRDYIDYMLRKKFEALQMSIELRMSIIINRHC